VVGLFFVDFFSSDSVRNVNTRLVKSQNIRHVSGTRTATGGSDHVTGASGGLRSRLEFFGRNFIETVRIIGTNRRATPSVSGGRPAVGRWTLCVLNLARLESRPPREAARPVSASLDSQIFK
jgi:hypothetical protein